MERIGRHLEKKVMMPAYRISIASDILLDVFVEEELDGPVRDAEHAGAQTLVQPPNALLPQHLGQHGRGGGALALLHHKPRPHHIERISGHSRDDSRSQSRGKVLSSSQGLIVGVTISQLRLNGSIAVGENDINESKAPKLFERVRYLMKVSPQDVPATATFVPTPL